MNNIDNIKLDIEQNVNNLVNGLNLKLKNTNVNENNKTFIERFREYYLNNIEISKKDDETIKNINLRSDFINEFPLSRIEKLEIDEYALGTTNFKETLSYQLEFGKYKYVGAGIGGGTAAKHGIYLRSDGNYYGKRNEKINNPDEFWIQFRSQLYNFITEMGNYPDFETMPERYPLMETVQAVLTKLCFLYYPNKFVNFCSKGKLMYIMKKFGISFDSNNLTPVLSYQLSNYLREKIPESLDNDQQYLGDALWRFIELLTLEDSTIMKDESDNENIENMNLEKYTKEDFLNEVFTNEENYDSLVSILNKKKNLILEGAPGVGKTFMAKRLAYSIIGYKDKSKVELIQFHQSYSYEDFIEGFRPTELGFELNRGILYKLCKKAEKDINNNYYLIIDEINRGNLSKIFGELLMLIENDKRGESLKLAYSEEKFSVPDNLYIIGLMNTADRSLALIDYALRRRFSFVRIEPAFDSEKFKSAFKEKFDSNFDNVINIIKKINEAIEDDKTLGAGFKIGHSYFCPNLKDRKGNKNDIQDIITYEIIPLLEEYWFDDKDSLIQWTDALTGVIND